MKVFVVEWSEDMKYPLTARGVVATAAAGKRLVAARFHKSWFKSHAWRRNRFGTWELVRRRQRFPLAIATVKPFEVKK